MKGVFTRVCIFYNFLSNHCSQLSPICPPLYSQLVLVCKSCVCIAMSCIDNTVLVIKSDCCECDVGPSEKVAS